MHRRARLKIFPEPEYDYDREVLRLTGLARYDGLVNREQKQILITPTWRAHCDAGSDGFLKTVQSGI